MKALRRNVRIRVAGILIKDNRILLVAHKKDGRVYWLLPGGGVNYGESLGEALKREFIEELNIKVDVGQPDFIFDSIEPSGKRHIVNICFNCTYISGDLKLGKDKRLHSYKFFEDDEIKSIDMFPPINQEILSRLNGKKSKIYLGKRWLDK